jgi:hypothetical protein
MKHLKLIFALLFIAFQSKSQVTISPLETNEYCPNTNYTFTVTIPGTNGSVTGDGNAVVISNASSSSGTFTFVGKFNDVNITQTFTVNYTESGTGTNKSKPFPFKKIKSLFSLAACNNISISTPVTAPICQTTGIPYSFTAVQWSTQGEACFGTINTYEYLLPAGWKLNNLPVSNGNTWQQANNSVTFTPDVNTAGIIQVRPINGDCLPISIFKGNISNIPISRPNPTFTITPPSLTFDCGTLQTKTFTVSTSNALSCPVSYSWNLGANNGWLYLGNPAPANFTTTSNSITLTSANGYVLPASVNVVPVLNGNNLPQITCLTSFSPFTSMAVISGINSFCTNQSSSTYTINAGVGNTVTWSTSNSAIASISNPTNSQVTVTAQAQGLFYVNATITNPCGQTVVKTSSPITVGTPMAIINGNHYCPSESAPCVLNATPNNNYLQFTLSAPLGSYSPVDADWQWEKISGNFFFLDNGFYNSATHTGNQADIYITGSNPTNSPLKLRCRVKNDCGWGAWRNAEWNDGTTTTPPPTVPEKYYKIAPNPTGGYAANISLLNPSIVPTTTNPIIIRLYTIFGDLLTTTQMYNNSSGTVYIYSYPYYIMYITITVDNHVETHTINKY